MGEKYNKQMKQVVVLVNFLRMTKIKVKKERKMSKEKINNFFTDYTSQIILTKNHFSKCSLHWLKWITVGSSIDCLN